MNVFVVHGYIHGIGEVDHRYFETEYDAHRFKEMWEDDIGYIDNIILTEVKVHMSGMSDRDLRDIVKKIKY